jgi:hypothetical protein
MVHALAGYLYRRGVSSMHHDEPTQRLGWLSPEPPTPVDLGYQPPPPAAARPPAPAPAPAPTMNAMAAVALIMAFLFFPLGIVLGHVAKRQITRTGEAGNGIATTALVISYLFLGLTVCLCCGGVYLFAPGRNGLGH